MNKIANKQWVKAWLALLIVGAMALSSAGAALAADDAGDAGSGPGTAMAPTDSWMQLANGEKQWYAFRDEGDQTSIAVRMQVTPGDRAFFERRHPSNNCV